MNLTRQEWLEKREQIALRMEDGMTADEIARDLFGSMPAEPFPAYDLELTYRRQEVTLRESVTGSAEMFTAAPNTRMQPGEMRQLSAALLIAADWLDR